MGQTGKNLLSNRNKYFSKIVLTKRYNYPIFNIMKVKKLKGVNYANWSTKRRTESNWNTWSGKVISRSWEMQETSLASLGTNQNYNK